MRTGHKLPSRHPALSQQFQLVIVLLRISQRLADKQRDCLDKLHGTPDLRAAIECKLHLVFLRGGTLHAIPNEIRILTAQQHIAWTENKRPLYAKAASEPASETRRSRRQRERGQGAFLSPAKEVFDLCSATMNVGFFAPAFGRHER